MTSLTAHAFVIVTAIALYVAKWPILVLAAIALFFAIFINAVLWGARRYPKITFVLLALLPGMLRR
jgi:hypothetical protein